MGIDKTVINVYTDGSYSKKGSKVYCGYGIYFANDEYKRISRKFTHSPITNNRAELYAILKSIILCNKINLKRIEEFDDQVEKVNIYSDSEYSVKTFNIWLSKWLKEGKEYLNKDLIDEIKDHMDSAPFKINLIHVRAHTGKSDPHSLGNEIVDILAKKGAYKEK